MGLPGNGLHAAALEADKRRIILPIISCRHGSWKRSAQGRMLKAGTDPLGRPCYQLGTSTSPNAFLASVPFHDRLARAKLQACTHGCCFCLMF